MIGIYAFNGRTSKNGSAYLGYVYRKRILPYDKCPINIKKKMEKIMFD